MIEPSAIPQLRFPEFGDAWQSISLQSISGKGQYGMNSAAQQYDGVNKYLRITDIDESTHRLISKKLTSPSGKLDDQYLVKESDLLLTRTGASTGKSYLYDKVDGKMYFAGFLIRFHINNADPYFVFTQTLRFNYQKWVTTISTRSGQPGINADEYGKFSFLVPVIEEQQKITDFLTAVDDKIMSIDKKIKLLKKYKRSVMQKILTQKTRFRNEGGNYYPEWEEKRMSDFSKFVNGYTFLSSTYVEDGDYKIITIANVQQGRLDTDKANCISALPTNIQNEQVLQRGDLLISMTGNVGRVCLVNQDDCLLNQRVGKIVAQDINPNFLYILLNRDSFMSHMIARGQGGAQDNLSSKDIMGYKLDLPSEPEQQRIAKFLTAIDDKIKAEEEKLIAAKEFKSALFQRMFV